MSAKPYADTSVSVAKSRADIDKLLAKWGVGVTQWTTMGDKTCLRFEFHHEGQAYAAKLIVDPFAQGVKWTPRLRTNRAKHVEKEARRLHRTLYWYVKAKIEAIEAGLETPTQAWFAAIEGPRGATLFEEMRDGLRAMQPGDIASMPALPAARQVIEGEVVE